MGFLGLVVDSEEYGGVCSGKGLCQEWLDDEMELVGGRKMFSLVSGSYGVMG